MNSCFSENYSDLAFGHNSHSFQSFFLRVTTTSCCIWGMGQLAVGEQAGVSILRCHIPCFWGTGLCWPGGLTKLDIEIQESSGLSFLVLGLHRHTIMLSIYVGSGG